MYRKVGKRFLDVLISLVVFPFLALLFFAVSILIYLDDSGAIFYVADRLGKNEKCFKMYKFRSMKENAPDIRNEDGTTFNSANDDRVTRIGKILRKTSIDELPQIINVLKGDMSFVGPRPDLPDTLNLYTEETRKKLNVLPGITGYSQAYYRNSSTLEERFQGDVYYAENVSFVLDIKIVLKTVQTVLGQKNVYRNEGEKNADRN